MPILIILLLIAIYYWPSMNAVNVNHKNKLAIFILNSFLGWTLIGWVIALTWSFKKD